MQPLVTWTESGARTARWQSENGAPPPERLSVVGDALRADEALRRLERGHNLLYRGDFRNAQQLLAALGRRLKPAPGRRSKGGPTSPDQAFRAERDARWREATTLGRVLVCLSADGALDLARAPDVREACLQAWGAPPAEGTLVSLRELLGVLGAAEWRRKGIEVPALGGRIHPHYGVFSPTRSEYVGLVATAPSPEGKSVLELGTGTGVLACLMARKGASRVRATDVDPRAVACARENVERLGLFAKVEVQQADLFPEGPPVDLLLFNPPWIPERPRAPIDRAIYDEGGATLERFLSGAAQHLAPGGEVWLILSDLAERLGLRAASYLPDRFAAAGLRVLSQASTPPTHGRAQDAADPLHAARAAERTSLYRLGRG